MSKRIDNEVTWAFDQLQVNVSKLRDQVIYLQLERDELQAALVGAPCPRPTNGRPDGWTTGQCALAGECGCSQGAPLMIEEQRASMAAWLPAIPSVKRDNSGVEK